MDANEREYAAAAAGMQQVYGYRPQRGDLVEVALPFTLEPATGVVLDVDGTDVEVSVGDSTLLYRTDELRPISTQESRRSR